MNKMRENIRTGFFSGMEKFVSSAKNVITFFQNFQSQDIEIFEIAQVLSKLNRFTQNFICEVKNLST
ncbi:hypothetical protein AT05_08940 [Schleiferia thermophila str. Yellowstone]|jgi:hypothetical protein|nr:hypothetical protein AT05_08940 [Schleiferia thermophila str. Yellowstone]